MRRRALGGGGGEGDPDRRRPVVTVAVGARGGALKRQIERRTTDAQTGRHDRPVTGHTRDGTICILVSVVAGPRSRSRIIKFRIILTSSSQVPGISKSLDGLIYLYQMITLMVPEVVIRHRHHHVDNNGLAHINTNMCSFMQYSCNHVSIAW